MNRHVLFYSNYCRYSRDVLEAVTNHGLRDLFVLVCVDRRTQLPDFVDRVPLIYTLDGQALADDAVAAFVGRLADYLRPARDAAGSQQARADDQQHATAPTGGAAAEDVSPWSNVEMGSKGGISDKFSFLEDASGASPYVHNFVDVNNHPTIFTPPDASQDSGNSASKQKNNRHCGGDSLSLEKFMSQRDNDLQPYMPPRPQIA